MVKKKKRLIIIDSNSVVHRAYHALPLLTTKKGELVNAVYGFLLVFFKAIREFQPDYIVACFDFPAPTFRHKKFKGYKAKRPPASQELYQQIPKIKDILKAFNVSIFEKKGFEADDLIGTISKTFPQKQILPAGEVIILSGDLDTLQLVDKKTKVYLLRKGVKDTFLYDENSVKEKYQGLEPEQLVDFNALKGDPSDNIPGVPGIGEKTALGLILEFGSLEKIYDNLEKIDSKTKDKLVRAKEQAFLSKELARINKKVPLDFNLEKCRVSGYKKENVIRLLGDWEFQSLIDKIKKQEKIKNSKEII